MKIQLQHPNAKVPTYAHRNDACLFEAVEQLSLSERGIGGFGSTAGCQYERYVSTGGHDYCPQ